MSIGDALKDMPEEYVEYVETKEPEQSEADKAIADRKPRWMKQPELRWLYVVFLRREEWRDPKPLLVYREAVARASEVHERPLMLVNEEAEGVEILPYGETPPARPEESEADKAIKDGKPRWVNHENSGWRLLHLVDRELRREGRCLIVKTTSPLAHQHAVTERLVTAILPYGETPPAQPEKPQAVASIVFKYDGGEWLHMAEKIEVENHHYEGVDHRGCRTYTPSSWFSFTLNGKYLGYVPAMEGEGRLTVTMLASGHVYKGKASVDERDDFLDMNDPRTDRIVFKMERDSEPGYQPDQISVICEGCPDCDSPTESRSMPDGIEQWCPVCNVKIDDNEGESWRNAPAGRFENENAEGPMHPDMIRAELQKAMDGKHPVSLKIKEGMDEFDDEHSYILNGRIKRLYDISLVIAGRCIDFDMIQSIGLMDSTVPDDIASERWTWFRFIRSDTITDKDSFDLAKQHNATDAQMRLIAAAPELADRMRELVKNGWGEEGEMEFYKDCMRLLRELGIPNVAPWYKDE